MIDAKIIKNMTFQKGADICGIAAVDRFAEAPKGFHPRDIYPDCRSVVVFASRFPSTTLSARTNAPYTMVRNCMVAKLDMISFRLCDELEKKGVTAIPIPSADPYDVWDPARSHGRGILSLKHAGELAGIGRIGKNTLLLNETFGNMIWLGAVLVSLDLEPDCLQEKDLCIPDCTKCLDACPQKALDGITIDQMRCRQRSTSCSEGGGWVLSCNLCRKVCPVHRGGKRTFPYASLVVNEKTIHNPP